MGVEKLTPFRSKLDALRSERERLVAEMRKLTHQIEQIDLAVKECLHLRAEDLKREQQERAKTAARKRK